ncbi:MAG: type II secretion system F family protein [Paracoccaceae bacterium]
MISSQSPVIMFSLYVALFVGILLAFDGLRQLLSKTESSSVARNRRMRMIKSGASTDDVLNLLLVDSKRTPIQRRGLLSRLKLVISQAGVPFGLLGFSLIVVAIFAVAFIVLSRVLAVEFALAASATASFGLPLMAVVGVRRKKFKKLMDQLPEALDRMSRGLSVGHPLNVTVNSVATDMADPIGTEFGIIQDQVSYGDDIAKAFNDFADRVDLEDARYLAVSVAIQHGTGGNLARVLQVLSKVIRDRATMRKRIIAISSEGRLSAMILTILPIAIFGIITYTTPSFYGDVQGDPLFRRFAIAVVSLIVMQAIILHRLVNFKF